MNHETVALSQLAHSLEGSQILQFSNAVKAMKAKGINIHNFTVGDFDPSIFPIPIELKNEVIKAYEEDFTNYPMAEGNLDLRQAISQFEKQTSRIKYSQDEVLVASGGRPLIYTAFQIICDKGDTVIYGTPSWNNHYYAEIVNCKSIEIATSSKEGFLLTAEKIGPHIEEANLLCLCSPQNPTGTLYSKKGLNDIVDLVVNENKRRKHGKKLYILFDAIYGCLTADHCYNYNPLQLNPEIRPYLITINAVSKIFAATGLRVGWCLGPSEVLKKMKNLLSHMGAWAPMAEQKATARFLGQSEAINKFLRTLKSEISERQESIFKGLMILKRQGYPVNAIKPQGGIYLSVQFPVRGEFVNGKELQTASDVANYLLEQSGFAILPFSAFCSSDKLRWFRISVGTCHKQDIPVMLEKLKQALNPFKYHKVKEVNI